MLVYRYEDESGHGPYRNDLYYLVYDCNGLNRDECSIYDERKRPCPYCDIFKNYPDRHFNAENFKYGFRSLRQLKKWFNGHHRRLLQRNGYKVIVYNIDQDCIYFGDKHIAFHNETEIYSIKELNTKGE